jgi:hypothetical protein
VDSVCHRPRCHCSSSGMVGSWLMEGSRIWRDHTERTPDARQTAVAAAVIVAVVRSCCCCCCCRRSALPQPSDSDWNRPKPRHPIVGPASYPKTQPDVISAPGLFRKVDPEALFFAFYYQPDTYQQYLAAQVSVSDPKGMCHMTCYDWGDMSKCAIWGGGGQQPAVSMCHLLLYQPLKEQHWHVCGNVSCA